MSFLNQNVTLIQEKNLMLRVINNDNFLILLNGDKKYNIFVYIMKIKSVCINYN